MGALISVFTCLYAHRKWRRVYYRAAVLRRRLTSGSGAEVSTVFIARGVIVAPGVICLITSIKIAA